MNNINKYIKKKKIKIFKSFINNKKNIFCIKRKKLILYRKEELLRQKILLFLIKKKKYNINNINIEKKIFYKKKIYKIDILIKKKNKPYILIECKNPNNYIINKNFFQLFKYSNFYNFKYLCLINGKINYLFKIKNNNIINIKDIPKNN
ncbi:MAG: type I restriction enzyme HsdR N-terminal domain-containing protein [Candidatus Shikimatogenerans sp. JK-2022]|nr:type I restriction enzyme HsdR N-terminal domain-containing protein [Candidatus Shikimatogenerans bostrichidophilus]